MVASAGQQGSLQRYLSFSCCCRSSACDMAVVVRTALDALGANRRERRCAWPAWQAAKPVRRRGAYS
jgi:hypothetical protein